jgi:hypothetical protein
MMSLRTSTFSLRRPEQLFQKKHRHLLEFLGCPKNNQAILRISYSTQETDLSVDLPKTIVSTATEESKNIHWLDRRSEVNRGLSER